MTRHVAHVEGRGVPTPARVRRQRSILRAVVKEYPALPDYSSQPPWRPIAGFAFPTRTGARDAVARLERALDAADTEWRKYVRVWDGFERR